MMKPDQKKFDEELELRLLANGNWSAHKRIFYHYALSIYDFCLLKLSEDRVDFYLTKLSNTLWHRKSEFSNKKKLKSFLGSLHHEMILEGIYKSIDEKEQGIP